MDKNLLISKLATVSSRIFLEDTADQMVQKTTNKRAAAGKKLPRYYRDISRDSNGNAVVHFEVMSSKSAQEQAKSVRNNTKAPTPEFYQCYIDIIPDGTTLFALAQGTTKLADRINVIRNADVKVFCSCNDFNWSGMKYNNKHINDSYSEGHHSSDPNADHGEDINPIHRDPNHQNFICKHLYSALFGLKPFAASIMKDAKNAKFEPAKEPEPKQAEYTDTSPYTELGTQAPETEAEQSDTLDQAIYEFDSSNTIKKDNEVNNALADFGEQVEANYQFGEPNENVPTTEDDQDDQDASVYTFEEPKKDNADSKEGSAPSIYTDLKAEASKDMFNQPVDDEDTEQDSVYKF